jgi:acetoacetyl-CoA reductase
MKKLIVLTGGNGGLGRELLRAWTKAPEYNLALLVRKSTPDFEDFLRSSRLSARIYEADLTNEEAVLKVASKIQIDFGQTWGVVNLAGVGNNGLSWKMLSTDFKEVIDGNLLTTFNVLRAFLPGMRESGGGRVINISSVVASSGVFGASAYVAAKSAIEGLTRALALENASKGITVNCLALGYFNAGMIDSVPEAIKNEIVAKTPMRRLGTGDDLAAGINFFLAEDSSFVTGQSLGLNGGLHFK